MFPGRNPGRRPPGRRGGRRNCDLPRASRGGPRQHLDGVGAARYYTDHGYYQGTRREPEVEDLDPYSQRHYMEMELGEFDNMFEGFEVEHGGWDANGFPMRPRLPYLPGDY
ncbi:hypothetical protein EJ08DRAFT_697585 [Tothia fuscella]|uniref:Uncharacterized protein n=1 Tax=Tothia fuscella TaxID=1048955 RepID=A0A9P4TXF9_9PEZI|nr:hypothetical protein EJ08DRAFT_697585 [Tothia fuscella]